MFLSHLVRVKSVLIKITKQSKFDTKTKTKMNHSLHISTNSHRNIYFRLTSLLKMNLKRSDRVRWGWMVGRKIHSWIWEVCCQKIGCYLHIFFLRCCAKFSLFKLGNSDAETLCDVTNIFYASRRPKSVR